MTRRVPSPPYRKVRRDNPSAVRRIVALLARQAAREWIASHQSGRPAISHHVNERPPRHGKS
ncbi:MAG: hypothetical protein RLO08_13950 [Parvibaculaceae bacterium]